MLSWQQPSTEQTEDDASALSSGCMCRMLLKGGWSSGTTGVEKVREGAKWAPSCSILRTPSSVARDQTLLRKELWKEH